MSRLPLPATDTATDAELRLTDPTDVDVHFIGRRQWSATTARGTDGLNLGWATVETGGIFCGGGGRAYPGAENYRRTGDTVIAGDAK